MASTSGHLLTALENTQKEMTALEGKLPFFQRFRRRYLTGRTLIAMKVASTFGAAKAFGMVYLAAGKGIFTTIAIQHPVATKVVVTIWSKVVFVAVGVAALFTELTS